jgi:hypothetical protein
MSTFRVLIECLPFLAFVGFGIYFLLTALVPSWREQNWKHWASYNEYVDPNSSLNPSSWLRQLGFAKPRKPIAEGECDEKSALLLYYVLAALFLFIGIGGLILIVYRSIT